MKDADLVSLSKGAAIVPCDRVTLREAAKAGKLPSLIVEGPLQSERVFRRVDLLRFAAERAAQRAAKKAPA